MHHVFQSAKDWIGQHVGIALGSALVVGAVFVGQWSYHSVRAMHTAVWVTMPAIEAKLEKLEGAQAEYTQVQSQNQSLLRDLKRELRTMVGVATAANCCDGDNTIWVQINRLSDAIKYPDGSMVRITRMGEPYTSFVARVDGEFAADNARYLIRLNRIGWQRLRVDASEQEIRVRIEEVEPR